MLIRKFWVVEYLDMQWLVRLLKWIIVLGFLELKGFVLDIPVQEHRLSGWLRCSRGWYDYVN